jgi:hypothetical protein
MRSASKNLKRTKKTKVENLNLLHEIIRDLRDEDNIVARVLQVQFDEKELLALTR